MIIQLSVKCYLLFKSDLIRVVDILGVTTVKEEMYTNKKEIFYEIK